MSPIELSVCLTRIQTTEDIDRLLAPYNAKRPPDGRVNVHVILWDDYKSELTSMALYGRGSDVSQVGAPLMSDLLAMNALRPFKEIEVATMGGANAFNPITWQSSRRVYERQVWAIPWLADPRVIYYWRDLLEKAGVDEATAFSTFDHLFETFKRLQASGIETPLVLPISNKLQTLQTACSWIWGFGGDFVTLDGKNMAFHQAPALAGLKSFFSLYRYMPKEGQPFDYSPTQDYFINQRAAVTIGNLGPGINILKDVQPEKRAKLGVALPPGPPYVGGSSLIIWKHARHEQAALDLIRYLVSYEAQVEYCQRIGYLPVRLDALAQPPYSTDYLYRNFAQALEKGRIFPTIKLGGLLEDRLSTVLDQIWHDIIADPDVDLEATISKWINPLVRRFELWAS